MIGKIDIKPDNNNVSLEINLTNGNGNKIILISYHIRFSLNYIEIGHITGFNFKTDSIEAHKSENIISVKFYMSPNILDLVEEERKRLGGVHSGGTELELLYHEENSSDIKRATVSLSDYNILGRTWLLNIYRATRYEDIVKKLIIETKSKLILKKIHKDILYYAFKHGHFSVSMTFNSDLIIKEFTRYNPKELEKELEYLHEYGYIIESNDKKSEYYFSEERLEEIKKIIKWRRYKDIFVDFLQKYIIFIIGGILAIIIYMADLISLINRIFGIK